MHVICHNFLIVMAALLYQYPFFFCFGSYPEIAIKKVELLIFLIQAFSNSFNYLRVNGQWFILHDGPYYTTFSYLYVLILP